MRFLKTKKGVALLATLVVVGVAAVGAYAFFSASGTGSATTSVGTSASWKVTPDALTGPALLPGIGVDGSTGTVTNPAADGDQNLAQFKVTIEAPTNTDTIDNGAGNACTASDFALQAGSNWTLAGDALSATLNTAPGAYAPGDSFTWGVGTGNGLNVVMVNAGHDQGQCKGATVNLEFDAT